MIQLEETHFALAKPPKPWLAAALNMVPGLGFLYLKQEVKAILFINLALLNTLALFAAALTTSQFRRFLTTVVSSEWLPYLIRAGHLVNPLLNCAPILVFFTLSAWLFSIRDAYLTASEQANCGYVPYRDNFRIAVRCSWLIHLSVASLTLFAIRVSSADVETYEVDRASAETLAQSKTVDVRRDPAAIETTKAFNRHQTSPSDLEILGDLAKGLSHLNTRDEVRGPSEFITSQGKVDSP